jgi:hypothetical protein
MAAGNLDGKQEWEGIDETRGRCNGARADRAKAQGRDALGGEEEGEAEAGQLATTRE